MHQPQLAVLDASHGDPNTRRNFRRELDASLAEFDVTNNQLPTTFEFDGLVVTGSRSSVYWDEPWIEATKAWVEEALARDLPALGICWGHQLLAAVCGGTVEPMGVYEVGYSEIERLGESQLLAGIPEAFTAFTSHSDAVTELPPNATPLAENEYSVHGFRADHVFGVQFHPEYDPKTARDLVYEKDLSTEQREAVLAEITAENYAAAGPAKRVFENFLEVVRHERTGEGVPIGDCQPPGLADAD